MQSMLDASSEASSALAAHLQQGIHALTAARTPSEMLEATLRPAIKALGALAGAVLLIDEEAQSLRMAGHVGYDPGTLTIWQDGPLDDAVPAADVLRTRQARYFEHAGALNAAYPELHARTGAVPAVASAVLPLFLDGRPLGSLVLDFKEPHVFTPDERAFLRTLAAHCTLALDRAGTLQRVTQQLEARDRTRAEEARTHEAFIAFTEAVGSELDLPVLVRQAIVVLQRRFPEASVGYYEEDLQSGLWKARVWSDDVDPVTAAAISAGLPADLPMFAQVLQRRQPVFADTWNDEPIPQDADVQAYGAAATYPLTVNGELHWILSMAFRGAHPWTEADQALVRGVGRGLNVALERTHTARQLMLQNAELQARTQALAAFADLTRDLALTTDPLLLIRRAQEIVMSMLADGAALYYVPEGDRWHNHSQHGDLHSPALQAAVDAGLPLNETRNLLTPWTTGQPHFQNVYDRTTDQLANVEHIGATATLPLRVGGSMIGVLAFVLFHQRAWSSVDRVLLETAVQSLELALDRAAKTRTLEEERVALQAFMRFTEVVGSDTDVQVLVQQAITLLEETRSVDVTYFERDGDLFKVRSWNPALPPELLVRLQAGLPLSQLGLARAQHERQAVFEDHWDAAERGIPEGAQHGVLAIQPFFEGQEMTSVLVMGSRTSVTWSERDRGIFRAVGRSLELALDRAAKTRRLEEERTALEAFTRFTEAVGTQSDVQVLVQQAITLLHETCAVDVAHFQREGELFKVTAWSASADPALLPLLQHGFILRDSSIAQVLRQNTAAFIDHWNDTGLLIAESGIYQAVAGHPYFVDHQLERVLMIGSRTSPTWTERDKRIFRAVGRSLELALDRAAQTQRLDEERAALEAFTHFTEQVGSETEVAVLVHQAITLLVDTCGADVTYLEREGDLFKASAWNAQFDPALLTRLHAGFPLKQSSLALILREQSAAFIDHWDAAAQRIEESRHLQAVAGYPVFQAGELQSVLIMGSRRLGMWTERQKGIFRAVGRSLDLALHRAQQTQLLRAQRDALAARTQELSIATEELEVFSYSVSHDLRTPVRHMLGFLQLARNALDGTLDARSARYLDVVGQAGQQMNALIDALLDVSRTARQPLKVTAVDLNRVLQHIQHTLTPDLLTRNIQWHVATLPVVQGDQTALTQVLTQFIENALKFTRTRDPAVIRVYAADQGDTWGVFVQDNGVGFDPRYRERLFNLFQRLHSAQEVTGTGVGLASVRRLILKHGGQVFAEGHVEQGATFGFSLPKSTPLNTRAP